MIKIYCPNLPLNIAPRLEPYQRDKINRMSQGQAELYSKPYNQPQYTSTEEINDWLKALETVILTKVVETIDRSSWHKYDEGGIALLQSSPIIRREIEVTGVTIPENLKSSIR